MTAPADRSTTATIAAYDAIAATYDQRQDRLPNILGSWLERFAATVRPDGVWPISAVVQPATARPWPASGSRWSVSTCQPAAGFARI